MSSEETLKDIREQIAAILASVDGMGVVHQYQRWAATWDKFLDHFKIETEDGGSRINGCIITRKKTSSEADVFGTDEDTYVFLIRFYYGLKDDEGTELAFQEMLEKARDSFRSNDTLNDSCETIFPTKGPMKGKAGLQIDDIDIRLFGNVLCHYSEGTLAAIVRVDV